MDTVLQRDEYDVSTPWARAIGVRHRRDEQQDAAALTPWLCAIADGLGGHVRGAEAARTALGALAEQISTPCTARELAAAIGVADQAVRALADGVWRNPGTTIVALAPDAAGTGMVGAWCGDSRAWLVTGEAVTPLTTDHADTDGGIMRCLGEHGPEVAPWPETFTVPAGHGYRVLLTTDGVHGRLEAADLAAALAQGLDALVAAGCAANTDNATAVLVDVDAFAAATR